MLGSVRWHSHLDAYSQALQLLSILVGNARERHTSCSMLLST